MQQISLVVRSYLTNQIAYQNQLRMNFFRAFAEGWFVAIQFQVGRQCMFQSGDIAVFGNALSPSCRILGIHISPNLDTRKRTGLAQVPKPTLPLRICGSLPRRTEGFVVWI